MTNTDMNALDTTTDMGAPERQRQRLALDALDGKPGAAAQLERIEATIATATRDRERMELAERERQARAAAEAEAAAVARREQLQRDLDAALVRRPGPARAVDTAADGLVAALGDLLAHGRHVYAVALELNGTASSRLMLRDVAHAFVQHKLGALLDMGRPPRYARRPLVEILGGPAPVCEDTDHE